MSPIDPVLPASRQPVPVSEEVQAELDSRKPSVEEIERRVDERTERLAANIDDLVSRLKPKRVARDAVTGVRSRLVTPSGRLRAEVIGAAAGAAVGAAVLIWWMRRR